MKKSYLPQSVQRQGSRLCLCVAVMVMILIGAACTGNAEADATVQKAYQLRLDGKVDKARDMLNEELSNNPDNAPAHYELARLNVYSATGKISDLKKLFAAAREEIDRAVAIEPKNVIYKAFAGQVTFLESYMALQSDQENAKEHVGKICEALDGVLELEPEYGEVMLSLVEIYGALPEEMGGDKAKAEVYAKKLEGIDMVLGSKARTVMMPEGADIIGFWQEIVGKHPHNPAVLEEMGKVYLREGKTDDGMKYLESALAVAPEGNTILLDMARYYIMMLRMEQIGKETAVPAAEDALKRYLATEPIAPLKAFALGLQAKLKFWTNEKEAGDKLQAEAEAIDAYFSKASAVPGPGLFVSPNELPHHHNWFFQPL